MKSRPTSITVVCWILIVTGGISLVTTTIMIGNPMVKEMMGHSMVPASIQYLLMYVGLTVSVVSGIMMLKGQNLARLLYAIWGVFGFGFSLVTAPMKAAMIPGLVIFAIIVFFLFRPAANEYFGK